MTLLGKAINERLGERNMREIKFRAIDVSTGQLLLFPAYFDIDNDGTVYRTSLDPEREVVAVMYTGLKDKNGVEIYEGDVITSVGNGYGDNETIDVSGKVYWNDEDASFMVWGWARTLGQIIHIEVIGNIYQNPELLKQTNE